MPIYVRMDSGTFWPRSQDQGTSIEGEFKGRETATGKFGPQTLLLIQEPDGELWKVSVSAKLADVAPRMQIGARYRLTYKGSVASPGGRTVKSIVVDQVLDEDEMPPDDMATEPDDSEIVF